MTAPLFNTQNIKGAWGSATWMREMLAEETRCCETIDARINQLESESLQLHRKLDDAELVLQNTQGFFARWSARSKVKNILTQMEWRRKVLIELYNARIHRTMTW